MQRRGQTRHAPVRSVARSGPAETGPNRVAHIQNGSRGLRGSLLPLVAAPELDSAGPPRILSMIDSGAGLPDRVSVAARSVSRAQP